MRSLSVSSGDSATISVTMDSVLNVISMLFHLPYSEPNKVNVSDSKIAYNGPIIQRLTERKQGNIVDADHASNAA